MPTALPKRPSPTRRLSLPDTVRFFALLARSRWLHRRLDAAHRRVDRFGLDVAGDNLLRIARGWLDTHEEIAGLLGLPAPPHVAEMREILQPAGNWPRGRQSGQELPAYQHPAGRPLPAGCSKRSASMLRHVHTFLARDGSGTGASALEDGSNLPGGASAWIHQDRLEPSEMTADAGVVGIGNAAEILAEVQRAGFCHIPNPDAPEGTGHP